jgi:uncharacterized membrane protein (DUF485 family)
VSERAAAPPVIERHAALARLAARRARVAGALTATVIAVYFGFILMIAFAKPLLATLLAPGLSLGIALGALVIVLSWALTFVYVRWANRRYDRALDELRQ